MKSLKNHLSFIFPLFVLLFSFQFAQLSERALGEFERKLTNDYSIVVVAPKKLDEAVVKSRVGGIKAIEEISSKKVLDRLKGNISSKNISLLKIALPKFYSIKLDNFPDIEEIEKIKKKLILTKMVSKVETFSKTHTKTYRMFVLLKGVAFVFSAFIFIVSLLLMANQIKIWLFEHKDRMAIMSLFGAPFWMKSAMLYRLAIVDSIISAVLVSGVYIYLPNHEEVQKFAENMDLSIPSFIIVQDGAVLLGVSLFFSLFAVTSVIWKMNKE